MKGTVRLGNLARLFWCGGFVSAFGVANTQTTSSDPSVADAIKTALSVYDQIGEGSMHSLNQIGHAYFALAEKATSLEDKMLYYQKAAEAFVKAAKAGCVEAVYNAGLAFNKLSELGSQKGNTQEVLNNEQSAAEFYRQSVNRQKDHKDLALKAAINLSILVLNAKIKANTKEITNWIKLAKDTANLSPKKSSLLLETAMTILLKMSTDTDKAKSDSRQEGKVHQQTVSA